MTEGMKTLLEALNELRAQGYMCDFLLDGTKIHCKDSNDLFDAGELMIDQVYRFEGDSNPDDMSVLYAVSLSNGTKGIIIDAYGTYEDSGIGEFMKRVRMNM